MDELEHKSSMTTDNNSERRTSNRADFKSVFQISFANLVFPINRNTLFMRFKVGCGSSLGDKLYAISFIGFYTNKHIFQKHRLKL